MKKIILISGILGLIGLGAAFALGNKACCEDQCCSEKTPQCCAENAECCETSEACCID